MRSCPTLRAIVNMRGSPALARQLLLRLQQQQHAGLQQLASAAAAAQERSFAVPEAPGSCCTGAIHSVLLPPLTAAGPMGSRRLHLEAASSSTSGLLQQQPESAEEHPSSASGMFTVEVTVRAFEPRYLEQASTVISDLMWVSFAPKSEQHFPSPSSPARAPMALALPRNLRRVLVNWKRTRFSVVKGPHIDKTGQEQFEMRSYQAVGSISTPSLQELNWFLDSIKLYQFPGVQLQVSVTSSTYLTPTAQQPLPDPGQEGHAHHLAGGAVLADHRRRIARYLGAPAQLPDTPQPRPADDLRSTLGALRQVLYAGLQEQRQQVGTSQAYQNWHAAQKLRAPHSVLTAPPPPGVDPHGPSSSSAAAAAAPPDPLQPPFAASGNPPAGAAASEQARHAAALLAAAEAVVLGVDVEAWEGFCRYPLHLATFRVGQTQVRAPALQLSCVPERTPDLSA